MKRGLLLSRGPRTKRRWPRPTRSWCRCRSTAKCAAGSRCRPKHRRSSSSNSRSPILPCGPTPPARRSRKSSSHEEGWCRLSFNRLAAVAVVALALSGAGCGYALAGRGSFLPDYIRVVAIPQLQNNSTFFQVEQVLTEKIRTEFIGRGKYNVVPEIAGADAVVSGAVTGI